MGEGFGLDDILHFLHRLPKVVSVTLDGTSLGWVHCCALDRLSMAGNIVTTVRITHCCPALELPLRFLAILGGVNALVVDNDALLPRRHEVTSENALRQAGISTRVYASHHTTPAWPTVTEGVYNLKKLHLVDTHAAGFGVRIPVFSHWDHCRMLEDLCMTVCPGGTAEALLAKLIMSNKVSLRKLSVTTRSGFIPAMCEFY